MNCAALVLPQFRTKFAEIGGVGCGCWAPFGRSASAIQSKSYPPSRRAPRKCRGRTKHNPAYGSEVQAATIDVCDPSCRRHKISSVAQLALGITPMLAGAQRTAKVRLDSCQTFVAQRTQQQALSVCVYNSEMRICSLFVLTPSRSDDPCAYDATSSVTAQASQKRS
jgi:hypothetical protein